MGGILLLFQLYGTTKVRKFWLRIGLNRPVNTVQFLLYTWPGIELDGNIPFGQTQLRGGHAGSKPTAGIPLKHIVTQRVVPVYVAKKMAKLREPSWASPTTEAFVAKAVQTMGVLKRTAVHISHRFAVPFDTQPPLPGRGPFLTNGCASAEIYRQPASNWGFLSLLVSQHMGHECYSGLLKDWGKNPYGSERERAAAMLIANK